MLFQQVDMSKVKLDAMKPWISKKITEVLGIEDDVVVEFVYNQLEDEKVQCYVLLVCVYLVKNLFFNIRSEIILFYFCLLFIVRTSKM